MNQKSYDHDVLVRQLFASKYLKLTVCGQLYVIELYEKLGFTSKNKYFGRNKKENKSHVNYSVGHLSNIYSKTVMKFLFVIKPTHKNLFYTLIKSMAFLKDRLCLI